MLGGRTAVITGSAQGIGLAATTGRVGRYASGVAIPRLQEPDDRGTRARMCILDDQLGRCAGEERFAEVVGRITRHRGPPTAPQRHALGHAGRFVVSLDLDR